MVKTTHYFLKGYNSSFFQLFFILISITSIIYLVKIAQETSILKITFLDFFTFFALQMPLVLFFAIPIAFFAAITLNLNRLSNESELVVLFSSGISPRFLLFIYAKIATLMSAMLLLLSLGVYPISEQLSIEYINLKKYEANLNIKSTNFGQKFGDWLVYVENAGESIYYDIVMFNPSNGTYIRAKSASIDKEKTLFRMKLTQGHIDYISPNQSKPLMHSARFETMYINNLYKSENNDFMFLREYWGRAEGANLTAKILATNILISIFPLISLFFAFVFGVNNPRENKNNASLYVFGLSLFYFSSSVFFLSFSPIISLFAVPVVWLGMGYWLYHTRVASRY